MSERIGLVPGRGADEESDENQMRVKRAMYQAYCGSHQTPCRADWQATVKLMQRSGLHISRHTDTLQDRQHPVPALPLAESPFSVSRLCILALHPSPSLGPCTYRVISAPARDIAVAMPVLQSDPDKLRPYACRLRLMAIPYGDLYPDSKW